MNRESKQFVMWTTIAGILFTLVGIYDLAFLSTIDKSGFVIALELVAGFCFLLIALLQWRNDAI